MQREERERPLLSDEWRAADLPSPPLFLTFLLTFVTALKCVPLLMGVGRGRGLDASSEGCGGWDVGLCPFLN